jgi:hypothetical protein
VDKPVTYLSHYPPTHDNCWSDVKLTTNWPTFLQDNFKLPETVDEAVDRLMMVLDDEQKIDIATLQEYDLIYLHFTLGLSGMLLGCIMLIASYLHPVTLLFIPMTCPK